MQIERYERLVRSANTFSNFKHRAPHHKTLCGLNAIRAFFNHLHAGLTDPDCDEFYRYVAFACITYVLRDRGVQFDPSMVGPGWDTYTEHCQDIVLACPYHGDVNDIELLVAFIKANYPREQFVAQLMLLKLAFTPWR